MKRLNFYPYYKDLLAQRIKTTTLRLHPVSFCSGEVVMLTADWVENEAAEEIHTAKIEEVYQRKLGELSPKDLEGESPDCLTAQSALYVMSCIYREILSTETPVWVVKFNHD